VAGRTLRESEDEMAYAGRVFRKKEKAVSGFLKGVSVPVRQSLGTTGPESREVGMKSRNGEGIPGSRLVSSISVQDPFREFSGMFTMQPEKGEGIRLSALKRAKDSWKVPRIKKIARTRRGAFQGIIKWTIRSPAPKRRRRMETGKKGKNPDRNRPAIAMTDAGKRSRTVMKPLADAQEMLWAEEKSSVTACDSADIIRFRESRSGPSSMILMAISVPE
jgi:hypothetical protein